MTPMFFFGTLMDPEVLTLVLGHPLDGLTRTPARIRHQRRVHVAGRSYPMLVPHPGGEVSGHLVTGLTPADRTRLAYYEGWEYQVGPVTVIPPSGQSVRAEMYVCPPEIKPDHRPWRLDHWQRIHKAGYLPRLYQLMASFDPTAGRDGSKRPPLSPGATRGHRTT